MSTVVMEGALGNLELTSVLQAVNLSRQCTVIRLWDKERKPTGEMRIKAGQLLDAEKDGRSGREAFHAILRGRTHELFRVERVREIPDAQPVGSLASLLLSAPVVEPAGGRTMVPNRPGPGAGPQTKPPTPSSSARGGKRFETLEGPLVAVAEATQPLQGILIVRLPEAGSGFVWERTKLPAAPEPLAAFVAAQLRAQQAAFSDQDPSGRKVLTTIELPEVTLVLHQVGADLACAYAFSSQAPLGLVRMAVGQLRSVLADQFGSAGARSSS